MKWKRSGKGDEVEESNSWRHGKKEKNGEKWLRTVGGVTLENLETR